MAGGRELPPGNGEVPPHGQGPAVPAVGGCRLAMARSLPRAGAAFAVWFSCTLGARAFLDAKVRPKVKKVYNSAEFSCARNAALLYSCGKEGEPC